MARIRRVSGVYVLLNKGKCEYVGKSNDIWKRLHDHLKDETKEFDSFFFMADDHKDDTETWLIETLGGSKNKRFGTRSSYWMLGGLADALGLMERVKNEKDRVREEKLRENRELVNLARHCARSNNDGCAGCPRYKLKEHLDGEMWCEDELLQELADVLSKDTENNYGFAYRPDKGWRPAEEFKADEMGEVMDE